MSNEISNQSSFGQNLAGYAMFPAASSAVSAAVALKTHGKNVIKAQNNPAFKKLDDILKTQTDTFTRSRALAETYDAYKDIAKKDAKLAKKLAKLNKKKHLTFSEWIKNIFRSPDKKVTLETLRKNTAEASQIASKSLANANKALENAGKGLNKTTANALEEALEIGVRTTSKTGKAAARVAANNATDKVLTTIIKEGAENVAKSNLKGAMSHFKRNFKNELGFKSTAIMNYAGAALEFFPKISSKIIPAFKEKGFVGGAKETGKALIQAGTDLVGYAAGGSIGRVIGSTIGAIISPAKGVGAKVGGFLGDMLGSVIVGSSTTKVVNKIMGEDKATTENQQTQVAFNGNINANQNQQNRNLDINDNNYVFKQTGYMPNAKDYANISRSNYLA